jgi:hypothetical protein
MISRTLALLVLAIALAPMAHAQAAPPSTVPVHFRHVTPRGTYSTDVEARATILPDSIRVVLLRGHLPLWSTSRERVDALSVGLAFGDTASSWDVRRQSAKVSTRDIKARRDTLTDSVVFSIPGTRGLALQSHWLVLEEHAAILVQRPTRGWSAAVQFYHGELDVFHAR